MSFNARGEPSLADQFRNYTPPSIPGMNIGSGPRGMTNIPMGGSDGMRPTFADRVGTSLDSQLGTNATTVTQVLMDITESVPITETECGMGQIMFIEGAEEEMMRQKAFPNRVARNKLICLSQVNFQLRQPENRKKWGSLTNCDELIKYYRHFCIQTQDIKDVGNMATTSTQVAIARRVRLYDISAASGRATRMGDEWYLQWHRYKWHRPNDITAIVTPTPAFAGAVLVAPAPAAAPAPAEHFWQVQVVSTSKGITPPPQQYHNENYRGHCEYIGFVTDIHASSSQRPDIGVLRVEALQAVFATKQSESYKKHLQKLYEVDLQYRMC